MKVFGRLCLTFIWCLATLMTVSKGAREIICGAKTVPIGCKGNKGIAIKRLYGCDDCLGDRCSSESILDKKNIDRVWSRCNLSSSCNIVPDGIKGSRGLGVEYHCAANVTAGCNGNDISLYCPEGQTIKLTNFYQLSCCQAVGCLPEETDFPFNRSALGRGISLGCQGKRQCLERGPETDLQPVRVHYICEGVSNRRNIPITKSYDKATIPPHTVKVVDTTTLSSTVIIVIIACVFGVMILLVINITIAVFCGPKKTSYVVTPRKPSLNHIIDEPSNDVTKWKTAKARDNTGMKENDLYQASDFRGQGYLSLKENDLYQDPDGFVEGQMLNHFPKGQMKDNVIYQAFDDVSPVGENGGCKHGQFQNQIKENDLYERVNDQDQMSNHFPEGQMKDNVIYQAFDDISPAGENGGCDLEQCQNQTKENDLYEGVDDLEQVPEVIHLPGYRILEGQGHSSRTSARL